MRSSFLSCSNELQDKFVIGDANGVIYLYSYNNGECEKLSEFIVEGQNDEIYSLIQISNSCLVSSINESLFTWDFETQSMVSEINFKGLDDDIAYQFGGERNPSNTPFVFESSFSSKSNLVFSALSDGSLRWCDMRSGEGIQVGCSPLVFGGEAPCTCVDVREETGEMVVGVGGGDGRLGLVDIRNSSSSSILTTSSSHPHTRSVFGLKFMEGGDEMVSWGGDGKVSFSSIQSNVEIHLDLSISPFSQPFPIFDLSFCPSTGQLAMVGGSSSNSTFLGVPIPILSLPSSVQDDMRERNEEEEEEIKS